ncbi:MAG: tetratricopeptide repeat protein [Candidatus Omnitrophica bacterium]|nr:tetratricopeptide repeat protein [Candidatus Omnitrophota bacterium]
MDKKKIILVIAGLSVLLLLGISVASFVKAASLNKELIQTKQLLNKSQEDTKRVQNEKEKITKENEKLQADAVSYLGVNSQLQSEKEKLQAAIEENKKSLAKKEDDLEKAKVSLDRLEKKIIQEGSTRKNIYEKESQDLKKKISSLEETLKKERGLYHYNLAVAFTQAKLFDEAIDSYEKSLSFDPTNADAHYNLGLLYTSARGMPEKAVQHYQEYLKLKPDAEDKDEVLAWIDKLKGYGQGMPLEAK